MALIGESFKKLAGENILSDIIAHKERYKLKDWEAVPFQIKNLSNGERMGVKGIYNINKDEELVNRERERARGTAFVIFDDNVSGGATLSDVCRALKENGFENLIPITFGVMPEKWVFNKVNLTKPTDNGGKGFNF
jgi:phosphoribosylpyrophosphate synthetase